MTGAELGRLVRTLRPLHPSQLWWRARYTVERRLSRLDRRPTARRATVPTRRLDLPSMPEWHTPGPSPGRVLALARDGVFENVGVAQTVGRDAPRWNGPFGRLWSITLQYHGWALQLARAAADSGGSEACALFQHYVGDWIERCGTAASPFGWNAYAIATRVAYWIRAHGLIADRLDARFRDRFLESLWAQAEFLSNHLEWDLRANHLLRDGVGLVWLGRFFDGPRASRLLALGTELGLSQTEEQVLPDGCHFERSPHYHLHVMEDVATLALLVEHAAARAQLTQTWRRMAEALSWLPHPDGDVPLFNDGGLRAACPAEEMLATAPVLGLARPALVRHGGRLFPDFGLAIWHGDPWTVHWDVGPVGPDCQPGHAHADTLSIECSLGGSRFIVDPGTHDYDDSERRRYDRSTAAHNTVTVGGESSSEVWHIFRVGRRATPREVRIEIDSGGLRGTASHDGFDHLPGHPGHTRTLEVRDGGALVITDDVSGNGRHPVEGGLLFAPDVTVEKDAGGGVTAAGPSGAVTVCVEGPVSVEIECRPYHPTYGVELTTRRLTWRAHTKLPLRVQTVLAPVTPRRLDSR